MSPAPAGAARRPGRLRPRVGRHRHLRHRPGTDAAALPDRHPRHRRRRRRGDRVPAQGLGRGAEPGRRPDQRPLHRPARPAAPVPAQGRAAARAVLRAAVRGPRPRLARCSTPLWVLVVFVACATAYAFFQVPYVAMPAEITDSYDERTRLMTWRVAILAFAIMLSGASAPGDPGRARRPGRLPRDGAGGRGDCSSSAWSGRTSAPARRRSAGSPPAPGTPARAAAHRRRAPATSGCCWPPS